MNHRPHRPNRRALAGAAALLVVAGASGVAGRYSAPDPAPTAVVAAAQETAIPYTASVSLEAICGPFPSARVTVDPTPGGHPDLRLEIVQTPYTGAPQHIFNTVTALDLAMPGRRVMATVPVEQASTISVYSADRSVLLPLERDLTCPQWADQGRPNR